MKSRYYPTLFLIWSAFINLLKYFKNVLSWSLKQFVSLAHKVIVDLILTMTKTTFVFDFDGTLVDSFAVFTEVFNQLKYEFGRDEIEFTSLDSCRQFTLTQLIKKHHISKWQVPKLVRRINEEIEKRIEQIDFYPNVEKVLKKLAEKNIYLILLSSNSLATIEQFLHLHPKVNFKSIYTGAGLFNKQRKLKTMLKKQNLTKEEVLYFGDQVRDIQACQKIGVDVCAVSWGFNTKEILAKQDLTKAHHYV